MAASGTRTGTERTEHERHRSLRRTCPCCGARCSTGSQPVDYQAIVLVVVSIGITTRMIRRTHIFAVVALVVPLTVMGAAVWFVHAGVQSIHEAYAVWWTADLVIEHMELNKGSWPRSWEELQATWEHAHRQPPESNRPRLSIEELRRVVEIDWTADPRELVKAKLPEQLESAPPFNVIRLRNGSSAHWEGKEPNYSVLEYLKWKEERRGKQGKPENGAKPLPPQTQPASSRP